MNLSKEETLQKEAVAKREDRLDVVYFECLEIMKMPEKWKVGKRGNIIAVYPHPIVSREAYRVEGIQYLPHKSYYLPEVLMARHIYWEDLLNNDAKPDVARIAKTRKPIKTKVVVTEELRAEIVRMANSGIPSKEIAEAVGASRTTVNNYIRKHRELIKEWAELKYLGLSAREIAEHYNVTEKTVWYHLQKEGYYTPKKTGFKKYSPEIIKGWVRLKDNGATYKEIAEAMGISDKVVKTYVLEYRKQAKETV